MEVVDDKVLEEIQSHQGATRRDANSPLYQIREKEIEISGRILAAKQQGESIVADARRKSVETINEARSAGEVLAHDHQEKAVTEAQATVEKLHSGVGGEVAAIDARVAERLAVAVESVTKAVIEV